MPDPDRSTGLSLVITTKNNASTIDGCIQSASFADEILVLDSFSEDDTVSKAEAHGARVVQEKFRGYGPQKERAIELASHDFILLLDADEALNSELAGQVMRVTGKQERAEAYRFRREEWLYWRWPGKSTRLTDHLRLFDRRKIRMGKHPVHAAPEYDGHAPVLPGKLRHFGHEDIAGQVDRINIYTTESRSMDADRSSFFTGLKVILAPPAAFFREYILRGQFLNGWAGFIASRLAAWHAFMRHAKRMEQLKRSDQGQELE